MTAPVALRFTIGLVPAMLIIPVAWLCSTILRGLFLVQPPADPPLTSSLGESQHWYPYPFTDVNDPSSLIGVKLSG